MFKILLFLVALASAVTVHQEGGVNCTVKDGPKVRSKILSVISSYPVGLRPKCSVDFQEWISFVKVTQPASAPTNYDVDGSVITVWGSCDRSGGWSMHCTGYREIFIQLN